MYYVVRVRVGITWFTCSIYLGILILAWGYTTYVDNHNKINLTSTAAVPVNPCTKKGTGWLVFVLVMKLEGQLKIHPIPGQFEILSKIGQRLLNGSRKGRRTLCRWERCTTTVASCTTVPDRPPEGTEGCTESRTQ